MNAIAVVEQGYETALSRVSEELSVEQLVSRVKKVHEVQAQVMKDGVHYGKVPGVSKPTLLKPGAEMLGMVFRLAPGFDVIEQLRDGDHLTVTVCCTLEHAGTGAKLGSGLGSCSTKESKYAWRKGERQCPACGSEAIIKGKEEYGGGWVCFAKKGGCGAKYKDKDQAIEGQVTGRVPNPDLYDQHNTVLKMAIKRAHVAAILFVTCASEIFTQDVEDNANAAEEFDGGAAGGALADELVRDFEKCKTMAEVDKLRDQVGANKSRLKNDLTRLSTARDEAIARVEAIAQKPAEDFIA